MTASKLIIWRHGETDWNTAGLFQGQADIPLNANGREQVKAAAQALAAEEEPVRIVASDLGRAQETAAALSALTGIGVESDPRFREISVGSWQGLGFAEVEASGEWEGSGDDTRRSPTGETPREVAARFVPALEEYLADTESGTLVVVAHGLAARVAACSFVGIDPASASALQGMSNAGWLVIAPDRRGDWRLAAYNRVAAPVNPFA